MTRRDGVPAWRFALLYLIFGVLWIFASDHFVGAVITDLHDLMRVQAFKGWAFVTVSALLLYGALHREFRAREQTEQRLRASQRTHATLLSNLPGMAYRCRNDTEWTMEFVSEGCVDLTGYHPAALLQNAETSYAQLIHPDDRAAVWQTVQTAVQEKQPFQLVYRLLTATGAEKWVWEQGRMVPAVEGQAITLEGFITDMSALKQAEDQVKQQLNRLAALREIDLAITGSLDLRVTLHVFLDQVTAQLGVDAADVLLFNPHTQILAYAAGRGFHTTALQHTHLRLGEGYAGRAALERRCITIPSLPTEEGAFQKTPLLAEEKFLTYSAVPLLAKGHIKGVLELFHRAPLTPDQEWLDFLEALAVQAAIAIDNAALFDDLQRSNLELKLAYDTTIAGWSRALDLRDQETEGHTQRVADMTVRLARALGISDADQVHILRGALLHDIGKMGIPDRILLKPGPLTEEEWKIMRCHPVYAYALLSPIAFLHPALDIPYCHHEKWDGSGYPRGLQGEQIPLAARIFAVVDVWDALRSDRPYRKGWPEAKVREHIRSLAGNHFDPAVVEAFLQMDRGNHQDTEHAEQGRS